MLWYFSISLVIINFTKFSLQTIEGKSPKIKNVYNQGLYLSNKIELNKEIRI